MVRMNTDRTGIYAIENSRSGRVYIGSSSTGFLSRWSHHQSALTRGNHSNFFLQHDWNRVGPGWFRCFLLEEVNDPILLREREQYWMLRMIDEDRYCYNYVSAHKISHRASPKDLLGINSDSISLRRAARILSVSERTVRRLLQAGKMAGYHTGREWRVTKSVIDRMRAIDEDDPPETGLPNAPYGDYEG
jgi:excisionase family DNA binding protein